MSESSRSRRRSRSHSRSGSESEKSAYSESFYSDKDSYKESKKEKPQKISNKKIQKPTNQNKKNLNLSRNSKMATPRRGAAGNDDVTRCMLSANRLKIGELRNKVLEFSGQITTLEMENRELKRQIRQQERRIQMYEQQENSMPSVMQRQSEEVNAFLEQMRRQKEKSVEKDNKLKDVQDELDRTQRLLKKMKSLVDYKQLSEREDLHRKLEKTEDELKEKNDAVKSLERYIENLNKNHKHELGIKRARHQETCRQLDEVRKELEKVNSQLQEKEKELDVRNIYANRLSNKPPHRLNSSISSTPIFDPHGNSRQKRNRRDRITENGNKDDIFITQNYKVSSVGRKSPNWASQEIIKENSPSRTSNEQRVREVVDESMKKDQDEIVNRIRAIEIQAKEKVERQREEQNREERKRIEKEREQELKEERERQERERERQEREKEERERERLAREEAERFMQSGEAEERQKQKELLLAKMKAIDEGKIDPRKSVGPSGDGLQNGHIRNGIGESSVSFGSYQPSFLAGSLAKERNKPVVTKKKSSDLLGELFLSNDFEASENRRNITVNGTKSPVLLNLGDTMTSSNTHQNGKLLPRRTRQPMVAVAQINGMSSDEEEIEEVPL